MHRARAARRTAAAAVLLTVTVLAPPPTPAQSPAFQGVWQSGDTTVRIVVNKREARGMFVQVGQMARTLGFKPGEESFVATTLDNYLYGEQTIRYGTTCHPNGRKVPLIGRLTPDGRFLAMHNYAIQLDANCRDTGQFSIAETLWQRVAQ